MKKILCLGLTAFATLLISCENNPGSDIPGSDGSAGANFHYSNDLQKMQLKGTVKSLTTNENGDRETFLFNAQGNIEQYINNGTDVNVLSGGKAAQTEKREERGIWLPLRKSRNTSARYVSNYTEKYTYDSAGRLNGIYTIDGDSILLVYSNHGAYVPFEYNFDYAMKQNLSQVILKDGTWTMHTTYMVEGSTMNACTEEYSYDDPLNIDRDTVHYTLTTAKMPAIMKDGNRITTFSYYPDNMLKEVKFEFWGIASINFTEKSLFSDDKNYLLIKEELFISGNNTQSSSYAYNEQKDLLKTSSTSIWKNCDYEYVYDDKGNWTKRTHSVGKGTAYENGPYVHTRTIVYY